MFKNSEESVKIKSCCLVLQNFTTVKEVALEFSTLWLNVNQKEKGAKFIMKILEVPSQCL